MTPSFKTSLLKILSKILTFSSMKVMTSYFPFDSCQTCSPNNHIDEIINKGEQDKVRVENNRKCISDEEANLIAEKIEKNLTGNSIRDTEPNENI